MINNRCCIATLRNSKKWLFTQHLGPIGGIFLFVTGGIPGQTVFCSRRKIISTAVFIWPAIKKLYHMTGIPGKGIHIRVKIEYPSQNAVFGIFCFNHNITVVTEPVKGILISLGFQIQSVVEQPLLPIETQNLCAGYQHTLRSSICCVENRQSPVCCFPYRKFR